MNISAKTEYACLAVMELAAHYGSGEPVRVNWIARGTVFRRGFSSRFCCSSKGPGLSRARAERLADIS